MSDTTNSTPIIRRIEDKHYVEVGKTSGCPLILNPETGSFGYLTDTGKLSELFTRKYDATEAARRYRSARLNSKKRTSPNFRTAVYVFGIGTVNGTLDVTKISRKNGENGVFGTVVAGFNGRAGEEMVQNHCNILRVDKVGQEQQDRLADLFAERDRLKTELNRVDHALHDEVQLMKTHPDTVKVGYRVSEAERVELENVLA